MRAARAKTNYLQPARIMRLDDELATFTLRHVRTGFSRTRLLLVVNALFNGRYPGEIECALEKAEPWDRF